VDTKKASSVKNFKINSRGDSRPASK
jgi:hypothetical protein